MNNTTLTAFPRTEDLAGRKSPSGCDCKFFSVNGIGLKVFRDRAVRDNSFWKQDYLHSAGIAPRVGNTFEMEFDGRTMYGHTTEIADCIVETDGDANVDCDGRGVHEQFQERDDCEELSDLFADCIERMRGAGCKWYDDHPGNFGLLAGRAVIIDCAGVSLPGDWDDSAEELYSEWIEGRNE